ncbi:MAG: PQQ-binding-like beta-propeller repeat protein [Dehalococcoidia bacterium]|nr:PQQ-binding-like beta-propeller repeat protein [Dehalococcoidia bacterium]
MGRISTPDGWAGPVVSDNTLYATSQKNGMFLAIDLSNPGKVPVNLTPRIGEKQTNFFGCESTTSSDLVNYGAPVVSDGIAYIAAYDGKIYAVDAITGMEMWRPVETKGPIVASPVLSGTTLVVASNNKLYAINTSDGTLLWAKPFKASGKIWSSPAIAGDKVYFGSLGHKLYAVTLASGKLFWEKGFDAPVAAEPLIVDGTIYVGTFEGKFYALDAETGDQKWDEPFKANDWFWSKAAYHNGTIYIGSLDKNVYAIDAATGKSRWSPPVSTAGPIRSATVVVPEHNLLLVACKSDQGFVYGIDLETGKEKWLPQNLGKIYADPWVEGNTVYYLNRHDDLYALDAQTGVSLLLASLDQK